MKSKCKNCFWTVIHTASSLSSQWQNYNNNNNNNNNTRLMAPCLELHGWAGTRKVNQSRLLRQETVSGSGISWAICKSAPYHSVFTCQMPSCHPTNQQHQSSTIMTKLNQVFKTTKHCDCCADAIKMITTTLQRWQCMPEPQATTHTYSRKAWVRNFDLKIIER